MNPDPKLLTDQDVILRAVAAAEMRKDVGFIKEEVQKINQALSENYLTRQEGELFKSRLKLLEKVVYTAVGVILIGVLTAILNGVFNK